MDLRNSSLFVTGGAGTLGRAIAARRQREGWTGRLTVYSTDDHKHSYMRKFFPDVQYVQGDIRNPVTLYNAMCGHDIVVHAAAVKVIPTSEWCSIDTYDVNVSGSLNVADCAIRAGVESVLAISTDKCCKAANAYGATKYLMEKTWQEYSRMPNLNTKFHLVRYGNVVESTGSVIEAWHRAVAEGKPIKITDPNMTRFWLSPQQAVNLVILALQIPSGEILIPKMPALSIGKLAEYTLGARIIPDDMLYEKGAIQVQRVPLRPGEKIHEELLTIEETEYATESDDFFFLRPTTSEKVENPPKPYSSDIAPELTREELMELLENK